MLYTIAPKGWTLAPLRDYLIGDATAMLLSHFRKLEKAKQESNPPTLPGLDPPTELEIREAHQQFATTVEFPLKPQQLEKIKEAEEKGHPRVAGRLGNMYRSWAATRAAGELLRKMEPALPRPIEFTRPEFARGYLLAQKGNDYYLLIRLFSKGHRYWERKKLGEGFVDCRTKEAIGGRIYPGVILPLELGRAFHERDPSRERERPVVLNPNGSHGMSFMPWARSWFWQKPTAPTARPGPRHKSCRGYRPLRSERSRDFNLTSE